VKSLILKNLDALGITYDTALPQAFWEQTQKKMGENPILHFVWVYPRERSLFGTACPISKEGCLFLSNPPRIPHVISICFAEKEQKLQELLARGYSLREVKDLIGSTTFYCWNRRENVIASSELGAINQAFEQMPSALGVSE
jgi:hypothetical protein